MKWYILIDLNYRYNSVCLVQQLKITNFIPWTQGKREVVSQCFQFHNSLRIKIATLFDKVNNEFSSSSLTPKHCVVTTKLCNYPWLISEKTLSKKEAGPDQDHFNIRWFINRFWNEINRKVLLRFSSPAGITPKCLHWTSLLSIAALITQQIHSVNPLNANS